MIASSAVYLANLAPRRILTHAFMFIMELDKGVKKKPSFSHKHLDNCLLQQEEQLGATSSEGAAVGLWSELWVSRWEGGCTGIQGASREVKESTELVWEKLGWRG